jgi:uncharacterized protein (TIGR03086 family)
MTTVNELVSAHAHALDLGTSVMNRVTPGDLDRPSPCTGWDLRTLLGHIIGQNHGFADAVEAPDAPLSAFADRVPEPDAVAADWKASADRVAGAFAAATPGRSVLLVEISGELRFPVETAIGFHLLDTVVHTWDVATSLDEVFHPGDELARAVLIGARQVPAGPARERSGASFAPVLPFDGTDPWQEALALLGRRP